MRSPERLLRLFLATFLLVPLVLSGGACASSPRGAPAVEGVSRTELPTPADATVWSDSRDLADVGEDASTRSPAASLPNPSGLHLQCASALVMDDRGNRLYSKNAQQIRPIASITKLMTAMVVLDARVPLNVRIGIVDADLDRLRHSRSRLVIGKATLTRGELMKVALMSSDNRAAHALARTTFRGGTPAFIRAMNRKAKALGMYDTYFADSSGLDGRNRSSAEDLVKMVKAAARYPFIRETTSTGEMTVYPFANGQPLLYRNTNSLVRNPDWHVEISKTGFINEAGRCLVMQTRIANRRLYIVLLHGEGKATPLGDSNRVRDWILNGQRTAAN